MRALSIIQPWAWLIIHCGKDIENRSWSTPFRGRFLVHASKGMTRAQYDDALDFAEDAAGITTAQVPGFGELERGGIVGAVDIVGVWEPTSNCPSRWHIPDQFGFQLRNPKPFPFVPCSGALGFWNADRLRDQLSEAARSKRDREDKP